MESTNLVLPFQLEKSNLRGRIVKISSVLDQIINAHNYPKPVSHLVAESTTLALALTSMLKFEGIFTLQAQGDGPVKMLVSDVVSPLQVRTCASFEEDRVEQARLQLAAMSVPESSQNHLAQYLGKGYLAFTVDRKGEQERYQGIVELKGASLVECVQEYFRQSEQIDTAFKMSVGMRDNKWNATAIMLQKMPEEDGKPLGNTHEDDWRRAMILLDSATDNELLSEDIQPGDMLYRLFHEEGVRVYESTDIVHECRCNKDRVINVINSLPEDDREYMVKDGKIEMKCEFCSRTYNFDPKTLKEII